MKNTTSPRARAPGRREQRTPLRHGDPYRDTAKEPGTAACPRCGSTYHAGRWTWNAAPEGAESRTCPACQRIEQKLPAGYVSIGGPFFAAHRDEVLRLVGAVERREREAHPLQRVIAIEDRAGGALVTTTDAHLARGLAVALHDAFKGELELQFAKDENAVRAWWKR